MNWRFGFALGMVALALGILVVSAQRATAKAVVTVSELMSTSEVRENIRLGARVAEGKIESLGGDRPEVRFLVKDIIPKNVTPSNEQTSFRLPVIYAGFQPDTLKVERDVILEGNYDGKQFLAKNLMTQCPSKYEPPAPGK